MYKMNEIKTKVEYFSDIMQLPCHEGEYQVMAVMFDEICFGELKNNKYSFEKRDYLEFEKIQSVRIFNKEKEYFYWRVADEEGFAQSSKLAGRLRIDNEGTTKQYIELEQVLFGSKLINNGGEYVDITEDRGFGLRLPSKWIVSPINNRLRLRTRNYLEQWDNGQLSFCDHRFVSIEQREAK